MYTIRALNPEKDRELFAEAYEWRSHKRLSRDVEGIIDFEDFVNLGPDEVLMGLFNGKLQAVYLIQDRGERRFEVHFTNRPGLARELLAAGALTIKNWLFENGASEIYGWIRERHFNPRHPVRQFAESIGFWPSGDLHVGGRGGRTFWWRKFSAVR